MLSLSWAIWRTRLYPIWDVNKTCLHCLLWWMAVARTRQREEERLEVDPRGLRLFGSNLPEMRIRANIDCAIGHGVRSKGAFAKFVF
ncbi:MAG: hypothetical protein JWL59_2196 [Chthoniobacteraceae bacterium]|nr:hypothetical protein [Chthoniobacteraceae bacterium]